MMARRKTTATAENGTLVIQQMIIDLLIELSNYFYVLLSVASIKFPHMFLMKSIVI
jgi:hypothetical protein